MKKLLLLLLGLLCLGWHWLHVAPEQAQRPAAIPASTQPAGQPVE